MGGGVEVNKIYAGGQGSCISFKRARGSSLLKTVYEILTKSV